MRIDLVHPRMTGGGAERVLSAWATHLAATGHEVRLHTLAPPAEAPPGVRVVEVKLGPLAHLVKHRDWQVASAGRHLARALQGADRVVAQNYPSLRWVKAALGARGSRPPVVWYCQEPERRLYRPITDAHIWQSGAPDYAGPAVHLHRLGADYRRREARIRPVERRRDASAVAWADCVAANSAYTAGLVDRIYGRRAEALTCGVRLPEPAPERRPEPLLLAVSPLNEKKNLHAAVEAFCRLAPGRPDLRLLVVGHGPEEDVLRTRLRTAGLDDKAQFPGRLRDAELERAYLRAACVLYPSVDEPLGLVPLEAMARGVPVVAADHGGPAETVTDGETGWLADPMDAAAWVDRVERILGDPEAAEAMGRAGRRRVAELYRVEDFHERLTRYVEEASVST